MSQKCSNMTLIFHIVSNLNNSCWLLLGVGMGRATTRVKPAQQGVGLDQHEPAQGLTRCPLRGPLGLPRSRTFISGTSDTSPLIWSVGQPTGQMNIFFVFRGRHKPDPQTHGSGRTVDKICKFQAWHGTACHSWDRSRLGLLGPKAHGRSPWTGSTHAQV